MKFLNSDGSIVSFDGTLAAAFTHKAADGDIYELYSVTQTPPSKYSYAVGGDISEMYAAPPEYHYVCRSVENNNTRVKWCRDLKDVGGFFFYESVSDEVEAYIWINDVGVPHIPSRITLGHIINSKCNISKKLDRLRRTSIVLGLDDIVTLLVQHASFGASDEPMVNLLNRYRFTKLDVNYILVEWFKAMTPDYTYGPYNAASYTSNFGKYVGKRGFHSGKFFGNFFLPDLCDEIFLMMVNRQATEYMFQHRPDLVYSDVSVNAIRSGFVSDYFDIMGHVPDSFVGYIEANNIDLKALNITKLIPISILKNYVDLSSIDMSTIDSLDELSIVGVSIDRIIEFLFESDETSLENKIKFILSLPEDMRIDVYQRLHNDCDGYTSKLELMLFFIRDDYYTILSAIGSNHIQSKYIDNMWSANYDAYSMSIGSLYDDVIHDLVPKNQKFFNSILANWDASMNTSQILAYWGTEFECFMIEFINTNYKKASNKLINSLMVYVVDCSNFTTDYMVHHITNRLLVSEHIEKCETYKKAKSILTLMNEGE